MSQWSSESFPRATTLTLLNVPLHYTEDMLKWTLESKGLIARCDFIYLTRVQAVGDALSWNMGHALLSFLTPEDAALARTRLAGHAWDSRVGRDGKQIVAQVEDAVPQDYQACVNYVNMITSEQMSFAGLLDWLDVPALNPGSMAWRDC
ncbi:unnamed protein product [Prorocentrum cordatum]|uniref:RRM domain-containing protein n=1 Tax=Prorocentrum cordatum TaxID=2364126 RepID=A0ABN9WJD2_9DINO|nr:unnamed protein product [Polarella glacialis]